MKRLIFHFDVISPFAYLAFEQLSQALAGLSYAVEYRPLLFAGLLKHFGQKGPAEVEPKRAWTFRHVAWLAHTWGVPMQAPTPHPFNPLALSRLLLACAGPGGTPGRHAVEQVFHHVWRGDGADANEPARLEALARALQLQRPADSDAVKAELRAATDHALARGIFGVPTIELDDRLFWGLDALPMVAASLRGDAWFAGPAWEDSGAPRAGVVRR